MKKRRIARAGARVRLYQVSSPSVSRRLVSHRLSVRSTAGQSPDPRNAHEREDMRPQTRDLIYPSVTLAGFNLSSDPANMSVPLMLSPRTVSWESAHSTHTLVRRNRTKLAAETSGERAREREGGRKRGSVCVHACRAPRNAAGLL